VLDTQYLIVSIQALDLKVRPFPGLIASIPNARCQEPRLSVRRGILIDDAYDQFVLVIDENVESRSRGL